MHSASNLLKASLFNPPRRMKAHRVLSGALGEEQPRSYPGTSASRLPNGGSGPLNIRRGYHFTEEVAT